MVLGIGRLVGMTEGCGRSPMWWLGGASALGQVGPDSYRDDLHGLLGAAVLVRALFGGYNSNLDRCHHGFIHQSKHTAIEKPRRGETIVEQTITIQN